MNSYQTALAAEQQIYANCLHVHELPAAFHYWSNRYLRPKMLPFGFDSPNSMFLKVLREQCELKAASRFVSIGAGNSDLEVSLAQELHRLGHREFLIECLDLNADMLERGRAAAQAAGVEGQMEFERGDFNEWRAVRSYDAVIANQSLHHVVNLEGLFAEIKRSLEPSGVFAISDMIGRNGHLRWPEALRIVHEFWRKLPPSYRFNQKLGSYEETFEDWDCSHEGFEGIRAQDVLPLLLEHFHFRVFIPFGNVIDPFVDRSFGGHFDLTSAWDQAFLDQVHERDELEMAAGHLTPTHLLAVMGNASSEHDVSPAVVRRSIRRPDASAPVGEADGREAYDWHTWPHPAQRELEIACRHLAEAEAGGLLRERTAWAFQLQTELAQRTAQALQFQRLFEERTAWAKTLERDAEEAAAWGAELETQLATRTAWAQQLQADLREHALLVESVRKDLDESTAWAQGLDTEVNARTAWAGRLEAEMEAQRLHFEAILNNPLKSAAHGIKACARRFFGRKDR